MGIKAFTTQSVHFRGLLKDTPIGQSKIHFLNCREENKVYKIFVLVWIMFTLKQLLLSNLLCFTHSHKSETYSLESKSVSPHMKSGFFFISMFNYI